MIFLTGCLPSSLTDWFSPTEQNVTVKSLKIAVGSSGAEGDELLQTLLDEYEAMQNQPGDPSVASSRLEIELQIVPEYARALPSLLASDFPPDLFVMDTFALPKIADDGNLLSLANSNRSLVAASILDDLYPEVQGAFTLNGSLYCLPYEYTTLALIYNRTIFDAAGIAYPAASWNWQDLQNAAQTITETPNDFYTTFGMTLNADFSRWLPFLHQAGGSITNDEYTEVTIDSAEALQSLEFYLGLNLDGYAIESVDLSSSWSGETFGTNRIGMIVEGSWILNYLEDLYPDLAYGVAVLPRGPVQNATVLFGSCYGLHVNSPNVDEALQLAAYLVSPEVMARRQAVSNLLPPRISLEAQLLADMPEAAPFVEGLSYAEPWQFPVGFDGVIDAMNGSMQQVYDAEIDAAEVLRVGQVIGSEILGDEE